jgi:putative transposase
MGKIIEVNEQFVKEQLGELVRGSVEDTLNALLDKEADRLCNAERYEHSEARQDTRAGHYERKLETKAGEVTLKVPKLRRTTFETAIIERYRRRECSVEEALIEMYLAGVSVRRVEDITEALWGTKVSASTISELNKKAYVNIEKWRSRPLEREFPYVYLDGIYLKRSWGGEVRNVAILVAIGVADDGYREILGVSEGEKEDKEGWLAFLRWLKQRGLHGVRLAISDCCLGLRDSLAEVFPDALWQRCIVHFYRNVFSATPNRLMREVATMLKAIHAQEDRQAATEKACAVAEKLKTMKLAKAATILTEAIADTLTYMSYPREHWIRIRTNNSLERLMREIRRRTRVVGCFPDGQSALMLAAARLRHVAGTTWSSKKYLNMELLKKADLGEVAA